MRILHHLYLRSTYWKGIVSICRCPDEAPRAESGEGGSQNAIVRVDGQAVNAESVPAGRGVVELAYCRGTGFSQYLVAIWDTPVSSRATRMALSRGAEVGSWDDQRSMMPIRCGVWGQEEERSGPVEPQGMRRWDEP
jgi:hypothetical protein